LFSVAMRATNNRDYGKDISQLTKDSITLAVSLISLC